jgi:hypothetical protein
MEDTESLSGLTSIIASYRPLIIKKFDLEFDAIYSKMQKEVSIYNDLPTRLLRSNVIILTIFKILSEEMKMPFSFNNAWKVVKANMIRHAMMLGGSSETSEFFDVIKYLMDNSFLKDEKDYKFWITQKVTLIVDSANKTTAPKQFDDVTELFCLNLNKVHPYYLTACSQQKRKSQSKTTLQHYLRTLKSFVGESKTVRGVGYAFLFDLNKLGIEMKDIEDTEEDTTPITPKEDPKADLPF